MVMSEFASICIYLVISLLVSLILLGVPFLFASNSSTYPIKPIFRRRGIPFLFLATIVLFFYIFCVQFDFLTYFQVLLSKVGLLLGGRALSFFFIKMGCAGGLSLAILFAVRVLITTEAASLPGNQMLPGGREPNLDLRLGPPEVNPEPINWEELNQYLSPIFALSEAELEMPQTPTQKMEMHILLENYKDPSHALRPLAEAEQLVQLKTKILNEMSELDPNPFWVNRRDYLISQALSREDQPLLEYSLEDLQSKFEEIFNKKESSSIFQELRNLRIYWQRFSEN